jgi:uncharacterized protein YndB with AHSA1/START domain
VTRSRAGGAPANAEPIRRSVTVPVDPERAFDLFTLQMGTWWPLDSYSRAVSEFADEDVVAARLEFQARVGGALLEHMSDGRVLPWAEVSAWNPPLRVVMAWRPHPFPEPATEVSVTFAARDGATLVEVEHRGWERLSPDFRAELYAVYVRGWTATLACFTAALDSAPN